MLSRKFIEYQYSALCNAEGAVIQEDIYGEAPILGPDMIVTRSVWDFVVSHKLDAYFAAPWGREGEKEKEEEKGKGKGPQKKEAVREWEVEMKKFKASRVFSSGRVARALQAITLRYSNFQFFFFSFSELFSLVNSFALFFSFILFSPSSDPNPNTSLKTKKKLSLSSSWPPTTPSPSLGGLARGRQGRGWGLVTLG